MLRPGLALIESGEVKSAHGKRRIRHKAQTSCNRSRKPCRRKRWCNFRAVRREVIHRLTTWTLKQSESPP